MLSARKNPSGRSQAEVQQTCKLDFTGFAKGSALLSLEFAGPRETKESVGSAV